MQCKSALERLRDASISDNSCVYSAFATSWPVHMLRLFSGLIPQAGRAAAVQVVTSELRVTTASNALYIRQYASQPAPSPAEAVSNILSCLAWSKQVRAMTLLPWPLQGTTKMLINGEFRESETSEWLDIRNPVGVEKVRQVLSAQFFA